MRARSACAGAPRSSMPGFATCSPEWPVPCRHSSCSAAAGADDAATLQAPTPLAKVLSAATWADRRPAVLQTIAMLAEFHPPLNDYVRAGARKPAAVTPQALPPLLFETLPALRLMGIRTL